MSALSTLNHYDSFSKLSDRAEEAPGAKVVQAHTAMPEERAREGQENALGSPELTIKSRSALDICNLAEGTQFTCMPLLQMLRLEHMLVGTEAL